MFYLTPNENNDTAKALYAKNIFSVTRQLRYSIDAGKLALDLCIFINGLPVITFELKNQLTKQNVENAVQQYKDDRSPKEQIFSFKRCMVHFAVDDDRVKFCTKLAAQDSWFLPFDKGYNDGAGNPPNPNGLKTDYLWKEILTKDKLTRIIESYAQVVTEVDEETKKKTVKQIFPRYHQLDVVEKLIADVEANGVGNRYLIQHSAGSGKSNSIAWLAYRLMELEKDAHPIFNSILVVTDRRILDKQIRDNIKQFAQVGNVVAWAEHSGDLRKAITDGKRIIITTIEKFPYVPADNLFIANNYNGRPKMSGVEFKNLIGRVGRIKFNLYGNVFFVTDGKRTTEKEYLELLREPVKEQKLSVVQDLKPKLKKHIVEALLEGDEIEYRYDGVIVCEECGNEIQFRISGFEYPVGAYNYDDYEIYGGDFEKSPIVGIVYSQEEFDIDYAYNEFNRVERLILEISDNPDLIYNISPREFEEVINRVLQDEGFETELTQATRDGGRDIVATKYEMGKPIVFYIECKRYGRRNSVGVSIVRSLYGVQTSDQINKSILVTTGHVTRGARRFVEKQNTMMSILDVNEIHHLIQRSAMKYR